MGRPRKCGCCCPPLSPIVCAEPDAPSHPSDPATYSLFTDLDVSGFYNTEDLARGCSATISRTVLTNGATSPGSYRFNIQVQPADGTWFAGQLLWETSGFSYDPYEGGSVRFISIGGYWRIRRPQDVPRKVEVINGFEFKHNAPAVFIGPVIEQDGKTYLLGLPQQFPDGHCWRLVQPQAADGTKKQYFSRTAYSHELSTATQTCLANGGGVAVGLSSDRLFELDPNGVWLTDNRPNLNYGLGPHPVTKFGWFAGVSAGHSTWVDTTWDDPFEIEFDVDELCAQLRTWGVYKPTNALIGSPSPPGTLEIDEPLDNGIPTGWDGLGLYINDDPLKPSEGGIGGPEGGGGVWGTFSPIDVGDDGGTLALKETDNVVDEYWSGTIWTSLNMPPPTQFTDDFQLTMEVTWHDVDPGDRCFLSPLNDPPTKEQRESGRNLSYGFFLSLVFRLGLHVLTDDVINEFGNPCKWGGYEGLVPVAYGGGRSTLPLYEIDEPVAQSEEPWRDSRYGVSRAFGLTANGCDPFGFDNVMYPSDGDRLGLVIRKAEFAAEPLADHRYDLFPFVNGRYVAESPSGPIQSYQTGLRGVLLRFPMTEPWRIGLYSYHGGCWSDFRVWVQL